MDLVPVRQQHRLAVLGLSIYSAAVTTLTIGTSCIRFPFLFFGTIPDFSY